MNHACLLAYCKGWVFRQRNLLPPPPLPLKIGIYFNCTEIMKLDPCLSAPNSYCCLSITCPQQKAILSHLHAELTDARTLEAQILTKLTFRMVWCFFFPASKPLYRSSIKSLDSECRSSIQAVEMLVILHPLVPIQPEIQNYWSLYQNLFSLRESWALKELSYNFFLPPAVFQNRSTYGQVWT